MSFDKRRNLVLPYDDLLESVYNRPMPVGSEAVLESYEQRVGGSAVCVYLSTPLTTGPRLVAARQAASDRGELASFVWSKTEASNAFRYYASQLQSVSQRVKSTIPTAAVIDPSELSKPDWTQLDYHRFWLEVIRRFVHEVVMADGWHLSNGSALEFSLATRLGLKVRTELLQPLESSLAEELLTRGIESLETVGLDAGYLRLALSTVSGAR